MPKKLFWVDMEMTGLDEQVDVILEVAAVVTDLDLNVLDQIDAVVFQPQSALDRMDDWCVKTHGASGLTAAVPNGRPLQEVEDKVLAMIDRHFRKDEKPVLAGNSVGQDRRFIDKYMRALADRLHYRIVDVSSFKEIFREKWNITFEKKNNHRAVEDIFESIRELKTYLGYFKPSA